MFAHDARSAAFRTTAAQAIEKTSGAEALETIVVAYVNDTTALANRVKATEQELRSLAAQVRQKDEMVRFLHAHTSAQVLINARMDAHVNHLRHTVDEARRLAQDARMNGDEDGTVTVPDLEAVLSVPIEYPEFTPQILAFTPALERDRTGQFVSDDGAVHVSYPFVGYSLVVRQQENQPRRLEPSFMVEEQILPESALRHVYALHLQRVI